MASAATFAELHARFPGGFDHAKSLYSDTGTFSPPSGAFVVVRLRGKPTGCGAVIEPYADYWFQKRLPDSRPL